MTNPGGTKQWCITYFVWVMQVGPVFYQPLDNLVLTNAGGTKDWRISHFVLLMNVGSSVQPQLGQVQTILRGISMPILFKQISFLECNIVFSDQQILAQVRIATRGRTMKRRISCLILSMNISSSVQQIFTNLQMSSSGRSMQRCISIIILEIDVFGFSSSSLVVPTLNRLSRPLLHEAMAYALDGSGDQSRLIGPTTKGQELSNHAPLRQNNPKLYFLDCSLDCARWLAQPPSNYRLTMEGIFPPYRPTRIPVVRRGRRTFAAVRPCLVGKRQTHCQNHGRFILEVHTPRFYLI
jgi:hypothetical protein